jgi:IS30 family transposase
MDTVRGGKKKGPVILTILFVDTSVMLMFLLPDGKAQTVVNLFDRLTAMLGYETFHDLFAVILTDNGSEFKYADALEKTMYNEARCNLFYCDPLASWQKGELEKNHEFIRYILPKGRDFSELDEEKITRIMNHINSTKRMGIANKSPYELIHPDDHAMHALMREMKMDTIPPDDVHLKPTLIR